MVLSYKMPKGVTTVFKRMEGITVKVDEDICVGCEECLEVCVFNGMEMIDNKAVVNQDNCLGCGRCETTCPNDAISISITDLGYVDKLIKDLEAHVEVSWFTSISISIFFEFFKIHLAITYLNFKV